jgi:hypothetical protein
MYHFSKKAIVHGEEFLAPRPTSKLENQLLSAVRDCLFNIFAGRPSAWDKSAPTSRIFVKLYVWEFFENLSEKFKGDYNLTRITGTLHEDGYKFVISHSVLLRMWNVSGKSCRENIRVWQNVEKCCRDTQATNDNTIWRIRFACWITKATNTQSECEIIIDIPL